MDRFGVSRCFMFCLDEPDRHPGFCAGNDRTLAFAERSNGRMIPFVRLALDEGPIEEARRCLDLGARGIKLHPRAQKFLLDDERLRPVFELAAERRVPILIHGGRGLPPIGDHLHRLVDAYPDAQLIIAHAGIADLAVARRPLLRQGGRLLRHLRLEPDRPAQLLPARVAGADRLRVRLSVRTAARVDADRAAHRADGRTRRDADPQHAARDRGPDRGRRAAARADGAAGPGLPRAAAHARADPPVPVDGDAAALDAPVGHDRNARARAERMRRAERTRARAERDPRAADGRARPLADAAGDGRRGRGARRRRARRSG